MRRSTCSLAAAAVLALALAASAAEPPVISAPLVGVAPAWADLAQLAATATLAALDAEGGAGFDGGSPAHGDAAGTAPAPLPRYELAAVHPGSARLTTGQEQAVTLEIDGVAYRLLLHDQDARSVGEGEGGPWLADAGPGPAAAAAAARAVAAAAAATAAAAFPGTPGSPGDGWAVTGTWPPPARPAEDPSAGRPAVITPATAPAPPPLALPPFSLAGPLDLVLSGGGAASLALRLPRPVELAAPPSRVSLPPGVAVRVVGAVRAGLGPGGLALGAPPPAWAAAAYGARVEGADPPPAGSLPPAAGILAATAGARAGVEAGTTRPPSLEVVFGEGEGAAALEAAPHPDAPPGSPPAQLRVRTVGPGAIELVPRVPEGEKGAVPPGPAIVPAGRGGPAPWAWPLPGARGPSLTRFDAALAELVAVARATRAAVRRHSVEEDGDEDDAGDEGGDDTSSKLPTLRLGAASSEAVSFLRVRLALRRLGPADPDAVDAAAGLGRGDPAIEHWEALVRVAPPAAPGGAPRVAALRADRLGAGGAGAPRSLTVSPLAEAALRGNATLPGDGDLDFVYPGLAYSVRQRRAVARA